MTAANTIPESVGRLQRGALVVGGLGLALSAVGLATNSEQFFRSWLFAWLFVLGLSVGCLSLLMVQYQTGGRWGLASRRVLEAGARGFPLVAVLFLPVLLGMGSLYVWTHADVVAVDPVLQHKQPYLNVPFFVGRAVFYFAVWLGLMHFLTVWSRELETTTEYRRVSRRLRGLSGGGLVVMGLTITFSAVDWAMSLNPHWFSTIYGILFMVGPALSSMALVILVLSWLSREPPVNRAVDAETLHDLGKLMLAFVMLWAYVNFSQFIIVWSGNVPEENPFYVTRLQGGWQWLGLIVVLFHFLLPFFMLLSRDLKRQPERLARVAALVLLMRLVDLFWLLAPDLAGHGAGHALHVHWLDLTAPVGLVGIWLWYFARQLSARSLLPVGEPEVREWLEAPSEARA